jgi:hypothetical protein
LVDAVPFDDFVEGHEDDFHVQSESLIAYIPNIEGELFFPTDGVTAVHLRPPRDARSHLMPPRLFRRIQGQIAHQ